MDTTKCIAALFDFDGVVMDTETQYTLFWNEIGDKYFPQYPEFGRIIKGQTLTRIYDTYFPDMEEVRQKITDSLNLFEKEMHYDFIPGVVGFMKNLREHGVKMAIVTSSNQMKMANVYRAHPELKELVDYILTAERVKHSKPAPDCFLLGADILGTVPENCVVFEDSFHGLEAGNAAGMLVVGLSTTNSEEAIRDKCSLVIPDFRNLTYEEMRRLL